MGLESNIAGLIRQFPRASVIWVANVLMSAALGYLAARYLLNLAEIPTFFMTGRLCASLIGFSMVPQAEIAMIIMQHGRKLGPWAVAQDVFSGMVLITAFTCLFSPLIIRAISTRWPLDGQGYD